MVKPHVLGIVCHLRPSLWSTLRTMPKVNNTIGTCFVKNGQTSRPTHTTQTILNQEVLLVCSFLQGGFVIEPDQSCGQSWETILTARDWVVARLSFFSPISMSRQIAKVLDRESTFSKVQAFGTLHEMIFAV